MSIRRGLKKLEGLELVAQLVEHRDKPKVAGSFPPRPGKFFSLCGRGDIEKRHKNILHLSKSQQHMNSHIYKYFVEYL